MRPLIRSFGKDTKYRVDFTLVPISIVLIEISVFITQFADIEEGKLRNLILMRLIHTAAMLLIADIVSRIYIRLQKPELSYRELAITGVTVLALGDALHGYLASRFGIDLIDFYRRLGIILIQGSLWFPAFIIIFSSRAEIFKQFRAYEDRIIVATRIQSRASNDFKDLQANLQNQIREELFEQCHKLITSISNIVRSHSSFSNRNAELKPLLVGGELRKLSMRLDTFGADRRGRTLLGREIKPFNLFIQQFRILSASIVKTTPLHRNTYAFVLLALATPPYMNFYSLEKFLLTYPVFVGTVFFFAHQIAKVQSNDTRDGLRYSSILIFVTGLLPLVFNLVGQLIIQDTETRFSFIFTALALPFIYFLAIEALQVLRPRALSLIRNDELKASDSLQKKVTKIVSEELSQNLSHQWAVFIHGKILTRLAATSLKLDTAAQDDDTHSYQETIESLFTLLGKPDIDFQGQSTDLQTEITSRLDPWIGLLTINLQIDPELGSARTQRVREVGEVIEELISNSIRHGKAKEINLQVTRQDSNDLEIIAIDNAIIAPPETVQSFGLGTRIFNLASDGRWSLTRTGSSTEFRLTMGIRS